MEHFRKRCRRLIVAMCISSFVLPICSVENSMATTMEMLDKELSESNNFPIKGKIVDVNGEPLIGATIKVKGTSVGTVSNTDGQFSLSGVPTGSKLVISYIGYKTQELVADKGVFNIVLSEDEATLDEVVVMGYGTLKKTQLVGAVENLSGEALQERTNSNVTRSLQGQIPGLNIIQVDGKPSHQGEIYVRGGKTSYNTRKSMTNADGQRLSIGQGGSALVLIDGVEGDLTTVNPEDIETISVLKDASSSAVYGARGAFGVILVTTKRPSQGRMQINYNGSISLNRRTVMWEDHLVTDGLQWLDNFVTFFQNDTRTPTSSGKIPGNVNNRSDTYSEAYHEEFRRRHAAGNINPYGMTENGNYAYYGSTNWIDLFYKDLNTAQTHNLSISSSNDRVAWLVSGRFYDQDGIYKIGDETFKTYNLRARGEMKLNKWITLENNTALFSQKYHQPMVAGGSQPLLRQFEHRGQPIYTPYNEDGTLSFYGASTMYGAFINGSSYQENNTLDVVSTTALNFNPIKDVLKLRADFTYKATRANQLRISDIQKGYSAPNTTEAYNTSSYKSDWRYNTDYLSSNVVLTWTPKLGKDHSLNVVGGWNIETQKYRRLYLQRQGLLNFQTPSFELMDGDEYSVEDDGYDKSLVGVFTRINYTLLQRYILEFSSRYDGSSLFPADERWGFFPSASVGWRLSEEPWMDWSRKYMNNFKLRANVGSLGNASIDPYSFMELMGIYKSSIISNGSKFSYTLQPSVIPSGLTWEKVTTYDIGLDMDFFNNRLSFSGDYYWRYINDLLIYGPDLPHVFGENTPKGNYGSLKTRGWELSLSWRDGFTLGNKPFNYNVKVSVWDSRTWVNDFYNANGDILNYYSGKELGEIWGFRTDGYFLSNEEASQWVQDTFHKNGSNFAAYAGDLKFLDLNHDNAIGTGKGTLDDHGDLERIGNESPRYMYGINVGANWNGIGLSVFVQGVGKRDWYPSCESGFFWGMYNRPYGYLPTIHTTDAVQVDYSTENWVVTNAADKPYFTRQVAYSANRNVGPLTWENDYYLQDASYWRLKNLTIDYTFPKKWTSKLNIEKLKVYFSGENLLTFSPIFKHSKMFDPEVIGYGDTDFTASDNTGLSGAGQGYSYPMLKSFTFGLNINF